VQSGERLAGLCFTGVARATGGYNHRRMLRRRAVLDPDPQQSQHKELQTDYHFVETLVDASPTFFVALNAQGRVRLMNRAMLDALGYTQQEVAGLDYLSHFVPPEDREVLNSIFKKLLSTRERTLNENHVLTKSGKQLLVEWHGQGIFKPDGTFEFFFGVGIDITERKAVEQALKRSEELSRRVLENVPGGIVLVDANGAILKANSEAQRFLGISYDELRKMFVADFRNRTVWEDGSACPVEEYPVSRALKTGLMQSATTIGVQRPDGAINWGIFTAVPLADPISGVHSGVVVTFVDITQRKRDERERLALERKLLEAQKLESLGILAGGIAHDFNNLLAAILGNANLMSMQLAPNSPLRPYLTTIENTTQVAARLCTQMLAYAGRGRTLVLSVDLDSIIEEMNNLLAIFVGEHIELKFELARNLPSVIADATQIRQVLLNLVMNASEAIGENAGTIRLCTGVIMVDREYLNKTYLAPDLAPGAYVFTDVIDTGCGMDEGTLARIFDPFFTTKFTGRGLGLAAVHGIVRGHKGAIKVDSIPGNGTTFRVLIPVKQQ
jgi:two-component system cell cycle sensor histidine kinase/response regulator CckA